MFPGGDLSEFTTGQEAWLDSPGHDKTSQAILLQKHLCPDERVAGSSADTQSTQPDSLHAATVLWEQLWHAAR